LPSASELFVQVPPIVRCAPVEVLRKSLAMLMLGELGQTGQNFAATFGLGSDDRSIATVDADGVALAAIQGLYELVKEKDAEIRALSERLSKLEGSPR
jgi:hypothetical protein